jgi:hypothetical protein
MKTFVFYFPSIVERSCAFIIKKFVKDAILISYDFRKGDIKNLFKNLSNKDCAYFIGGYIKKFPKRSGETIIISPDNNIKGVENATKIISGKDSMIENTLKLVFTGDLKDVSYGAIVLKEISFHKPNPNFMGIESYLYTKGLAESDESMIKLLNGDFDNELIENGNTLGKAYLEKELSDIKIHIKRRSKIIKFGKYDNILLIPCNYKITLTCIEGLKMYPNSLFVIMPRMFFDYKKEKILFSYTLRSNKIDVSKIAKDFGGGGSNICAGFTSEKNIFELKK